MKTVIYYFSATGNSLVVARGLAAGLHGQLIPMARVRNAADAREFDRVGFVFPVYMFGMPLLPVEFLKTVKIDPQAYVFCVSTFGGLKGRALSQAGGILRSRGITLAAGFAVEMPGNYTPFYGALPEPLQQKVFARQKIRLRQILGLIESEVKGRMEEFPFLLNFLLYKSIYRYGVAKIPLSAKGFWAKTACDGCGTCARVCPEKNIRLLEKRPVWSTHCQHCLACLHWCPPSAIEYKKLTLGKKRYHHPDVSVEQVSSSEN